MRRHFIFVLPALALALALAGCRWTGAPGQAARPATLTQAAADKAPAAQPSASPSPPPPPVLRPGMRGQAVRLLQRRLAALKYYPGRVNGRFGSNTLEAVWAFQETQGLHPRNAVTAAMQPAQGTGSPRRPYADRGQPETPASRPVQAQSCPAGQPRLHRRRSLLLLAER